MATINWVGNGADVRQISTITLGGTWLATETATVTCNGKDVVVTVGTTGTSTANVAIAIKEALAASTRLDGTGTTDSTSNAGGQQYPEFTEMTATVSGSVVTLIATRAGHPFTLTVGEASTSGTITLATPQAAAGKHFWNDGENWSAGSVPANDDVVVFRDTSVSCLYGLPNGSLEVTMETHQSFTGTIGLPIINTNGYYEYRQRYPRLDDSGTGTNIAHRFGIGQGIGSSLINLKHSTVKCSPIVYNTGQVGTNGTHALNICCTAATSTINILAGTVDFSSQDSGTSAFLTVTQTGGVSRCVQGIHTTSAGVYVRGGAMTIGGTGAIAGITVGGQGSSNLRLEGQTGTIAILNINAGGTVDYASTATLTDLRIYYGGVFDARSNAGAFTVTSGGYYQGARFLDPYKRMAVGTDFLLYVDPSPDLQFGADAGSPLTIQFN